MRIISPVKRLKRGIHPSYCKDLTFDKPVKEMNLPQRLGVIIAQHIGSVSEVIVKKGDYVRGGDILAKGTAFVSANVHSPTSGKVVDIDTGRTLTGTLSLLVFVEPDGEDKFNFMEPVSDWRNVSSKLLIDRIYDAGIIGMGGAGFPTHVKLSPPENKPVDIVIINGAECEPYLTADHRVMLEYPEIVCEGADIIRHILKAKSLIFAIEDNKPDAIRTIEKYAKKLEGDVAICVLPTQYPQGAEKQQIYCVTGRVVPAGGLPMDVGVIVENVGTVMAVREAVVKGKQLVERVTTVTGSCIKEPSNVKVRIGTCFKDLIEFCGGFTKKPAVVINGGPMMGISQPDISSSYVTKTTSGVLALTEDKHNVFCESACISCGMCVDSCPMQLMPSFISYMIEAEDWDKAKDLGVLNCIECGCCAYVCPARRPLVQWFKQAKMILIANKKGK